jgi:hypothetical protein
VHIIRLTGQYSLGWESHETHKYTVRQNAFLLRCKFFFGEVDRILDSVSIFVTPGISFIFPLGPSPGNILL